jgi:Uncharacterised MFS-type transporter YbfB
VYRGDGDELEQPGAFADMTDATRAVSPARAALIGLIGLASAMGVGRFAFTPLLPLIWVGGTFMVVTMTGIQEARRIAGASAPRLVAAMTTAFAVGQLVGPFTVTSLGSSSSPGVALPHGIAAAVLLLGVVALAFGPAPAAPPPTS